MGNDTGWRRGIVVASLIGCVGFGPMMSVASASTGAHRASATLYVSVAGNDAATGTASQPLRSVAAALRRAPAGATLVLNSGVYRESLGTVSKPVTIEPASGASVWLSGADVVSGWSAVSNGWVHTGWNVRFCHNCYDPRALDKKYPWAGLPDMVFFNGNPLAQVGRLDLLTSGTFYVDYNAHRLYVGSNPTGVTVEAAARVSAARFGGGAAGSVVRNIGFKDFAPDQTTNQDPAMVLDSAPNMLFDHDVFMGSASRGLSVYATGVTVRNSVFLANGFQGFHGNRADHLVFQANTVASNNAEKWYPGFSMVASVSGVKITNSYHVLAKANVVEDNYSNGLWFDVSSYDLTIVDNVAARNYRNGIYVEISDTAIVASNLSYLNQQAGIKLSGATHARVWNNTSVDNYNPLSVHYDGRVNTNQQQVALGITWITANNTFANNILSAPNAGSVGPMIFTLDSHHPANVDASQMMVGMTNDVYARSAANRPGAFAEWVHVAPKRTSYYPSLAALKKATGYEAGAIDYTGYSTSPIFVDPAHQHYGLVPGSPLIGSSVPLPADIAAAIGVTTTGQNRGVLNHA